MIRTLLFTILLTTIALAGCHEPAEDDGTGALVLAFTTKDDFTDPDADPQRLADWIAEQTGREVELYHVDSEGAAITAMRFGHAHAAFMDGGAAWIAWTEHDLEAIAADQNSDGRTYYEALAVVRTDSGIEGIADLAGGKDSCHTGWLKSAGMLMPVGHLIGAGHMEVVGDPDDLSSIESTLDAFFGTARVPASGDPYYNYDGALRCLSEGQGDVAFVKDTTVATTCDKEDAPDWCLPIDDYQALPPFGQVPSHPVMVAPHLGDESRTMLLDALLALNDDEDGQSILEDVLNTPGIVAVDTAEHLGSYSDTIQHVPGLAGHYKESMDIEA